MSASADLQSAIEALLAAPGALRVNVPVVKRRTKQLAAEIEAAAANKGLCLYVMPPLPTGAEQDVPFVFFNRAEVRVRIIEQPAANTTGADAYDLVDDVATALQGQLIDGLLADILRLAARPTEMVEDPRYRIIDVLFNAVYQLNPEPSE